MDEVNVIKTLIASHESNVLLAEKEGMRLNGLTILDVSRAAIESLGGKLFYRWHSEELSTWCESYWVGGVSLHMRHSDVLQQMGADNA